MRSAALAVAAALWASVPVAAQAPVTGYVSMLFDVVGRPATGGGREADSEWRPRVFLEHRRDVGDHIRLRLSGYVEGLVADRHQAASPTTDVIARPRELYVELVSERADLRVGYSRLVWGRLDELQPTDVVNPLDLATFFFEGRAEARIAVPLARARLFLPASTTLEAVVVPQFRPGRFDQLDEPSSPFNLLGGAWPPHAVRGPGPRTSWSNLQGGARLQTTSGRVDWSVSAYRGFETFGVLQLMPDAAAVEEVFPRFTMIGGDFETVRGEWGIRGEVAAFVVDSFQAAGVPRGLDGRSIEGGIGADRKAGDFRVSGNVLLRRRFVDGGPASGIDESDVNLIASIDRSFSRETRSLQVFGVYDPTEATSFLRGIFTVSLTDRLSIEASGGLFSGSGPDTLGRFTDRDFVYVTVRRHF
ncbi:MAG: hypothetical protein JJE40_09680 [Vicinamibacteria bacterium]|nr:hypothetical protein [Vicinamibacteria bacterium]